MSTQEAVGRFFANLSSVLTQQTVERERQADHFFRNLKRQLEIFRASKRHLDRYLATDFTIFSYIVPDENRISGVVRDLLDPHGPHGQESLFLEEFLKLIGKSCERYSPAKVRNVVRETPRRMCRHLREGSTLPSTLGMPGLVSRTNHGLGSRKTSLRTTKRTYPRGTGAALS